MSDLHWLDATAQAELVRRREVSALELVDAAIDRIERLNPLLNAVVTPMYDSARAAAARELPQRPFTGVPFLLKDLGPRYAGVPLTWGSAFLRDYIPAEDSELVVRHKQAGLIVLGKTNAPELGLRPVTEPALFGPTRNPWDLSRTPGGSSGGSAAAVSAGMVPFAHANDGGGSIRIPASCCGLFGLKPTRARNPLGPDHGGAGWDLAVEHAVTRSVRDSAALLDATAGPRSGHLGDPYWAPAPARPFLQEVGASPGRLRIAFAVQAPTGARLDPECVAAVRDAAVLCEELGHVVEEASPAIDGAAWVEAFSTLWSARCAATLDGWAAQTGRIPTPDQIEPFTWALQEQGRKVSATTFLHALQRLQMGALDVARFFQHFDVWLTPTLAAPPVPLGAFDSADQDAQASFDQAAEWVPFTPIFNVTGQPAMSVPLYWTADGLPVGTHFAARYGDEATLFRLAAQLESARPWAGRRPVV